MARNFIHELHDWPGFAWDSKALAPLLSEVRLRQGLLVGKMRGYGLASRWTATLKVLTEETIKSSAIEGVKLDPENVRSSLARRLGLEVGGLTAHKDRTVDGVVDMMLDATQKFSKPLTRDRLFDWHTYLFPGIRTARDKFRVGAWRDDSQGPMQVVSGPVGRHKIHYEAPTADHVDNEMRMFFAWFEGNEQEDPLLKAAIAHLWFVTVHPFEDGNGRIGRAIAEMCLARSDGSTQRFYSMSSQILEERKGYYEVLEKTQAGSLDITEWLTWFLECLGRAIEQSNQITSSALEKELFWKKLKQRKVSLNDRQTKVLNKLFRWFEGKLTRDKWMKMTKASSRTALRDIEELIALGVIEQEEAGGRSTSYRLKKIVEQKPPESE
ncbi:MAG TPA: Fic family protein [Candidatus Acidoferrales bacterium]|jgi:Fic family protein|nr:Fic family protein [Candidatus Acidoferrales bacterium]